MIADLAALLFFSRDYAHRAHLRTNRFAHHMALEEFYKGMTKAVDSLVESYQGRFELIDIPYVADDTAVATDPVQVLGRYYDLVRGVRYEAIPREETMLQNQMDEIEHIFATSLYKLKNLM